MQPQLYEQMAHLGSNHFWFRARNVVLQACLAQYQLNAKTGLILDAGCGTGANFSFLGQFGQAFGVDLYHDACRHCAITKPGSVAVGRLEALPFRENTFAVVALLDVLEHVDDQLCVLTEMIRVLCPGGALLVTVPAFRHLWSGHDVVHQHRRRYRAKDLRDELCKAGLTIDYLSYYNAHLYPLVAFVRLLHRRGSNPSSDMKSLPSWLNSLLFTIFSSERYWVGRIVMPVGVSLVAVAKKSHHSR